MSYKHSGYSQRGRAGSNPAVLAMKKYRLENDTKWNYGIRYGRDWATMDGRLLEVFCFKQDRPSEPGECIVIKHGFWFSFVWRFKVYLRIERGIRWNLKTKNGDRYSRLTSKR